MFIIPSAYPKSKSLVSFQMSVRNLKIFSDTFLLQKSHHNETFVSPADNSIHQLRHNAFPTNSFNRSFRRDEYSVHLEKHPLGLIGHGAVIHYPAVHSRQQEMHANIHTPNNICSREHRQNPNLTRVKRPSYSHCNSARLIHIQGSLLAAIPPR